MKPVNCRKCGCKAEYVAPTKYNPYAEIVKCTVCGNWSMGESKEDVIARWNENARRCAEEEKEYIAQQANYAMQLSLDL